jgi:succinyl-diaminopimelate desuccinylase
VPSERVRAAQAWLGDREEELLHEYRALLRIPSIESAAEPGAPFGAENRRALDFMLERCEGWGMRCADVEGYCGHAEFGEGPKLVMSFGHLDVVPVGPGWKHDPFGAELVDGYVYARGAVDDKGPTMASLYAMQAVQATGGVPGVRFRSFFGCNEESGFHCIRRYNETEEAPTYGIAPDSGWPLYHGEKGIANFVVARKLPEGRSRLVSMSGGQRPNIVIDSCEARLAVPDDARPEVEASLADSWDGNVAHWWEGGELVIQARGKAAHGGWPVLGDNAAMRVFRFLREMAPRADQPAYEELIAVGHIGGDGLGIAGADEPSGPLSANLGVVETRDGWLYMTVNARYPVTWSGDELRSRAEAWLAKRKGEFRLAAFSDSKPLYFPKEHPMVAAICDAYREETGEDVEPKTMNGGTYARAVPNTVSVGTGWDGDGDAHETDERLAVASLHKMARIYAHILLRLAEL